jgi:hypothetical protein
MPEHDSEEPDLSATELELAERLERGRPVPRSGFRGALSRRLVALDPGWGPRPARVLGTMWGYLGLGVALIGLGTLIGVGAL